MRATILIVDDEEPILDGLERALHGTDYDVHTALGAWAGIEAVRSVHPDIIVSDQCMPGLTGLDFLSVAREHRPESIRILLSGRADLETALLALNQGEVFRFLTKPVDRAELLVTLGLACSKLHSVKEGQLLREQARQASSPARQQERSRRGVRRR